MKDSLSIRVMLSGAEQGWLEATGAPDLWEDGRRWDLNLGWLLVADGLFLDTVLIHEY